MRFLLTELEPGDEERYNLYLGELRAQAESGNLTTRRAFFKHMATVVSVHMRLDTRSTRSRSLYRAPTDVPAGKHRKLPHMFSLLTQISPNVRGGRPRLAR